MPRIYVFLLFILLLPPDVLGQTGVESERGLRSVDGQTIYSQELPKAEISFNNGFRYVGGHRVNLYGNADAEQHLFVQASANGKIERFYWVQFEHFLPSNSRTYDYASDHKTKVGSMEFAWDVKAWPDYATMQGEDPQGDGAAATRLLAQHNLTFPKETVRVRMFNLPTADHRSELMIIYGEALSPHSDIPLRTGGVNLEKEAPDLALRFLEHARENITIIDK